MPYWWYTNYKHDKYGWLGLNERNNIQLLHDDKVIKEFGNDHNHTNSHLI